MSKVKQLNIQGVDYDIQDASIPDSLGTAGQVLQVNSGATGLEYGSILQTSDETPSSQWTAQQYLKNASTSDGVLTLTKQDDTTVTYGEWTKLGETTIESGSESTEIYFTTTVNLLDVNEFKIYLYTPANSAATADLTPTVTLYDTSNNQQRLYKAQSTSFGAIPKGYNVDSMFTIKKLMDGLGFESQLAHDCYNATAYPQHVFGTMVKYSSSFGNVSNKISVGINTTSSYPQFIAGTIVKVYYR